MVVFGLNPPSMAEGGPDSQARPCCGAGAGAFRKAAFATLGTRWPVFAEARLGLNLRSTGLRRRCTDSILGRAAPW